MDEEKENEMDVKDEKKKEKDNKHRKNKRALVISFIVVFLITLSIFGTFGYHVHQVVTIMLETQAMAAKQIVNSNGEIDQEAAVNMTIKTKGGYAVVEETLKNYLNEAFTLAKNAENVYNTEEIEKITSIENMKKDGPDFVATKAKLVEMKKAGEDYINKFIELCTEENLISAIDNKDVSEYYKKIYKKLATDGTTGESLKDTITQLEKTKTSVAASFDYLNNIINFLSENKTSWTIQGDKIIFYNQQKLDEYNKIISEVPTIE